MKNSMTSSERRLAARFGWLNRLASHPGSLAPEISVIIPTYNCLSYLPRALRSIQLQQLIDIEILVLDDGSTDDTWQYLKMAADCDKRIRPIGLSGVGVARARNIGLKQAKGRYIAFLDADDHWGPGKLARQLAFHQAHPEVTLSFCNYLHFNLQEQSLGDCFGYWARFERKIRKRRATAYAGFIHLKKSGLGAIFADNVIGTSGVMISPKAIGKRVYFDESLGSAEDWDFWLKLAKIGPIACTDSVDMGYLMRPGSETSKLKLRLKYMAHIQRRYLLTVLFSRPTALFGCTSRLLTGYAEYFRGQTQVKAVQAPAKSAACHFGAFILSPSIRLLRAMLADLRNCARNLGTHFHFANR